MDDWRKWGREEWLAAYSKVLGPPRVRLSAGSRYIGKWLCPFHDDRNPSFAVSVTGWFRCFACGEEGGWLDFLRKMNRPLPRGERRVTEMAYNARKQRHPYYYHHPHKVENAKSRASQLLSERSIAWLKAIEQAEANVRRFRAWKEYRGLTQESVVYWRLGLGKLPGQKQERLILPVFENGRLVALKGRRIGNGPGPKWISAKGSRLAILGADHAMEVADGHVLLVCESPVDAILVMQEWPDVLAVASSSGATSGHDLIAGLISGMRDRLAGVVVVFDNDLAGTPNATAQWHGLWEVAERNGNEAMMAWLADQGFRDDLVERYLGIYQTRSWPRIVEPSGPRLASVIAKAVNGRGLPVTLWRWPEKAEIKEDLASWILKGKEMTYA